MLSGAIIFFGLVAKCDGLTIFLNSMPCAGLTTPQRYLYSSLTLLIYKWFEELKVNLINCFWD